MALDNIMKNLINEMADVIIRLYNIDIPIYNIDQVVRDMRGTVIENPYIDGFQMEKLKKLDKTLFR